MNRRRLGLTLVVVGAVIALVGIVGGLSSGGDDAVAGETSTTTSSLAAPATGAPSTAPSTTSAPVTSTNTTTTTTTTLPRTTTTEPPVDPAVAVAAYIEDFAAAIAAGDVDALFDRLHPTVLETFDEPLCRAFIEREILQLVNYRQVGDVTGPETRQFAGTAVDFFLAPITFTFQGAPFEDEGGFAFVDDEVRWFTTCR